jgi:hypothetical protein
MDLKASLHTLRRLQHLELCGSPMQPWHPEVRLPASLTKLQLAGLHGDDQPLPPQVSVVPKLHTGRPAEMQTSPNAIEPPCCGQKTQCTHKRLTPYLLLPCPALQLAALTQLRILSLDGVRVPADGYGVLAALAALQRLQMTYCYHLPSCLSRLIWITSLHLMVGALLSITRLLVCACRIGLLLSLSACLPASGLLVACS